jgi:hypothetical protein
VKALGAIAVAGALLAGCQTSPKAACPVGQAQLRTAQLFLGGPAPTKPDETALRRFVDQEVTPRFPDGVTVVDGGGQWTGAENRMIREAAKVVMIVLPPKGDPTAHIEAVRRAYRAHFRQDPVVVLSPPACVTL